MKANIHSIYLLLLVLIPGFASGQHVFRLDINYAPSLPTGNFKDVTDGMSWRGWEVGFLYQASSRFAVGIAGGTQAYYKRYPRTLIHTSGNDLSAVINNSIELLPIMLKVKYDLSPGSLHPFIAVGAGINVVHYDKYYGEFVDYNHVTRFVAQPEVGVFVPFGRSGKAGLNLGVGYFFMPFKNDEVDNLNNVVFKGGLGLKLD